MSNPTELERREQEADAAKRDDYLGEMSSEKEDPRDLNYELKKLGLEMASMAERAAMEMKQLRARNATLAPAADAYEVIRSIIGLLPGPSQGMEGDFAWQLEQRAEELRKQHG